MKQVLVIEDEPNVASFLKQGLEESDYQVWLAYDTKAGQELLKQKSIDLIVMDIILPGQSGLEFCAQLRSSGIKDIPILMLTALGTTDNVVEGLRAGADDYLVKPFKFRELVARLEALSRRRDLDYSSSRKLIIGDLELDRDSKLVFRGLESINLTSTEFRLLEYLMLNKNRVVSRIDILEHVWDVNFNMGTNVVDVYVNYLRNKIDKKYEPKLITTVFGMGYVIRDKDIS